MAEPIVVFETNQQVAHKVLEYQEKLRPSPPHFTLRPYQYQGPENTEWWFIPSTDWPAYHHSKLCVHQYDPSPEMLLVGFYVEHGYGGRLKGLTKQNLIMEPDWYWLRFLRHARDGDFDPTMRETLARSRCPLTVWLDAQAPERGDVDKIEFTIRTPKLCFEVEGPTGEILSSLRECGDLRSLAGHLAELGDTLQWYWLNLVIGIKLRYGNLQTGTWRARDIWQKALEPWEQWIA